VSFAPFLPLFSTPRHYIRAITQRQLAIPIISCCTGT